MQYHRKISISANPRHFIIYCKLHTADQKRLIIKNTTQKLILKHIINNAHVSAVNFV